MAGRYKAYQEYKDSGVEWLKEIPIHWDCKKLKFFLNDLVRGPFGSALKKEFFTTAGIKVYEQKNCIQDSVALGDSYISEDTYRDLSRFTVTNGDLLMSCSGTIGRIVEVTEPYEKGIINQALLIMRINEYIVNKAFFKHIFRSEDVQKQIKDNTQGGAMQNLVATDVFKSVSFTVPPLEEQQKIANFLDHETAKIDTLIAKQEKLIELLKEKRQAVISHAVTKGLNPDAPMKDSGVEWLGEVPEHWVVSSIKYLSSFVGTGGTPKNQSSFVDDNDAIKWFAPGDFSDKIELTQSSKYISFEAVASGDAKLYKENSVLVIGIGATLGKVALCKDEFSCNQQINMITPNKKTIAEFITFSLSAQHEQMKQLSNASTIGIMNQEKTKSIQIAQPPLAEQIEIVKYLNIALERFKLLESKATKQVDLLKERKTALISAAVTGKIDVRDWEFQGVEG